MEPGTAEMVLADGDEIWAGDMRTAEIAWSLREYAFIGARHIR